jgi:hypothetical protein
MIPSERLAGPGPLRDALRKSALPTQCRIHDLKAREALNDDYVETPVA